MKKLILLLNLIIAGVLSGFSQSPDFIRKEFSNNVKYIKESLPRRVNDRMTWKSLDYNDKNKMIVLTYEFADITSPLSWEEAQKYYESNLVTLRDSYKRSTDALVKYAVDGEMILRFAYISPNGDPIATLDYPSSVLKD
ncbi:MAG: hypothetical protein NC201_06965 [Prevotella sp.]|nr:hypothetical protein [Bacteroides sp.]MCM1366969.1 hypothetical protein [Prevotella sp.]MCM1436753.1 hypothetical protein [Prevotella sp.]